MEQPESQRNEQDLVRVLLAGGRRRQEQEIERDECGGKKRGCAILVPILHKAIDNHDKEGAGQYGGEYDDLFGVVSRAPFVGRVEKDIQQNTSESAVDGPEELAFLHGPLHRFGEDDLVVMEEAVIHEMDPEEKRQGKQRQGNYPSVTVDERYDAPRRRHLR